MDRQYSPHICLAYQVLLPSQPGDSKRNSNAWEQGLWAAKVGATTVGIGALFAITGIMLAILQAQLSSILSGMDVKERCCTSCCSTPISFNNRHFATSSTSLETLVFLRGIVLVKQCAMNTLPSGHVLKSSRSQEKVGPTRPGF